MSAGEDEFPVIQLCVRSKDGLQFLTGGASLVAPTFFPQHSTAAYSADGEACAVISDPDHVTVYNADPASDHAVIGSIERKGVHVVQLSPKHKFLVTWERHPSTIRKRSSQPEVVAAAPVPEDDGDNKEEDEPAAESAATEESGVDESKASDDGNLIVWDVATGSIHVTFHQKKYKPEEWPYLRWTDDEFLVAKRVTNELQFFDGQDLSAGVKQRLRLPKVEQFSFAPLSRIGNKPKSTYTFVSYVPGSSKGPAKTAMYDYPLLTHALASKSFFNSDLVEFMWSFNGEFVLVKGISEVQKDSYYGSAKLFLLSKKGDSMNIIGESSDSRTTVADCQWSPVTKEFVLIYGRLATLHSAKDGNAIFEFGSSHWNTVRYNPQGTFIVLGGFGNMAGDFKVWDRESLKEIGSANAHGSKMFEWAPDGLRFLTAGLFPWRRVDNELKVWKYTGELLQRFTYVELYQVMPRTFPDMQAAYPFPKLSPDYIRSLNSKVKKQVKQASKAVFVPPHLRKQQGAGAGAPPPTKLLHPEESKPRVLAPSAGVRGNGSDEPKKKQRNRPKKSSGADDSATLTDSKQDSPAPAPAAPEPAPSGDSVAERRDQIEKKIKNLKKKVKQIDALKERTDNLNSAERQKVSKEREILDEIADLEVQLDELK
eukprot:TRINITY_DN2755_c0_g1_i1.p1 TRINITY_DN2755_c0_g1~~TRINITY_DN2755_c0_g1_i1.p1  ORF type:complete len:653 (-),score=180.58 TRINITY_DN2755_c0_g1_i1:29-1987(-)